jgi:hypothetical protein
MRTEVFNLNNTLEKMYTHYKSEIKNQLKFQGKQVIIDPNKTLGKENTFWHISSLTQDSVYKSCDFFPCINHVAIGICKIECNFSDPNSIVINVHRDRRLFCVYRCMFIKLIPYILKKIETGDFNFLKAWESRNRRVLIRYTKEGIDYLIVLEKTNSTYKLITAYPLFLRREKEKNDKQYQHFNSKKII